MVSVKKIVMVALVAVTMLGLGGLFPHAEAFGNNNILACFVKQL